MKAVQIQQTGGPEVLRYLDLPEPEPAPGQVVVSHRAVGVNFIDIYHRTGLYPRQTPFIPGMEAAGVITALGQGVRDFTPGQRVAYTGVFGAYGDSNAIPADKAVPLPEEVDFDTAAALMLQGMTAHYLVHDTHPVGPGQTILLHAAAGGVGLLVIQMAKALGARVIGTVSTPEKAALARSYGADEVIIYTSRDFTEAVNELTQGQGVDAVYDSVGQSTFQGSLGCLKPRGILVSFGQSSGIIPPFDPAQLGSHGSLYLTRPSLFHYIADRPSLMNRASQVLDMAATGALSVTIGARYPLDQAAQAHRDLENRQTVGKVLLIPEEQQPIMGA
ncbi:quinone oxidoreductase family protein [Spirochaeta lutea]|uniref:NADPH--quinone reductase n=1 Tax=Spirochaeta lutea TaxID=1480694 RepID=A0A098QTI3_9SPIO|nr:quinone oxidoreductase [Spirochaeta lutea]KGE70826.1 NADPH--quinone reductase [Spirochaeta lutea]